MELVNQSNLNYVDEIRLLLPDAELWAQLAEEAAELAQAALKIRRVLDGTNPTPKDIGQAHANVIEEISDVETCLIMLGYASEGAEHAKRLVREEKLPRWAGRLRERGEKRGNPF